MTAKAITIVTHPPSKNLNKVEEKNTTSRINKIAKIGIKINLFQPLTKISKNVARIVSINIDPVTAIPYAAAKFAEFLKLNMSKTTPINKNILILDKYTSLYSFVEVYLIKSLGI